jgi:hypothetical protein
MISHNDILSSSWQLYDKSAQSGTLLCFRYASFVRERVKIISVPPKMAPVIKEINYYSYLVMMFKNRMMRRIFGSQREKLIGGWRKLHNKELHNLYSSHNIIRMIKPRKMRCMYSTHETDERCIQDFGQKMSRRDHLGDLDVYGRILKCILQK